MPLLILKTVDVRPPVPQRSHPRRVSAERRDVDSGKSRQAEAVPTSYKVYVIISEITERDHCQVFRCIWSIATLSNTI